MSSAPWVYDAEIVRWVDGDSVYVVLIKKVERMVKIDFGFGFSDEITVTEDRRFRVDDPIRLYGIDTPETHGRKAKDPDELKRGKAAASRAAELIPEGRRCEVRSHKLKKGDPRKGKYGRYLLEIYPLSSLGLAEPRSVNQILLDEGHAKPYFGGKK